MARAFDGSNDDLVGGTPARAAYPMTIAARVNLPTVASNSFIFMLVTSNTGQFDNFALRFHSAANRFIFRVDSTAEGGSFDATAPGAVSANTWYTLVARAFSATDRRIQLNGGSDGTNTTNCTPVNINSIVAGAHAEEGVIIAHSQLRLAEVGIWSRALSDEEAAAYADGYSPEAIGGEDLADYWRLIGRESPEPDLVSNVSLTVSGASQYDHPNVIYPRRGSLIATPPLAHVITAGTAAFSWSPQSANFITSRIIVAGQANFAWSPQSANFLRSLRLVADTAAFAWSPQPASLVRGRSIVADTAAYAWSPQAATFVHHRVIAAGTAAYLWSPQAATFLTSGGVVIAAEPANYVWTPAPAAFVTARILVAGAAAFVWTPQAANFLRALTISAQAAAFSWSPQAADFRRSLTLVAGQANFVWTVFNATFRTGPETGGQLSYLTGEGVYSPLRGVIALPDPLKGGLL